MRALRARCLSRVALPCRHGRRGGGAGAQGRSKLAGRAAFDDKARTGRAAAPARRARARRRAPITIAAQSGGGSRRRQDQHGAAAILLEGVGRRAHRRRSAPSASLPMQPDGSQAIALPQPAIMHVAAVGIGRQAIRGSRTCRRRYDGKRAGRRRRAPRSVRPSPAISTSGTGVRAAQMTATSASERAAPAQRRLEQPDQQETRAWRAAAVRRRRASRGRRRPGRLATHSATASIHSMP